MADSTSTISRVEDQEAMGCMRLVRFELHHDIRIFIPIVQDERDGQEHLALQQSLLSIDLMDE